MMKSGATVRTFITGSLGGLVAFSMCSLSSVASKQTSVLKVQRLEIVDSQNQVLITLGAEDQNPFVELNDKEQEERIKIAICRDHEQRPSAYLSFQNSNKKREQLRLNAYASGNALHLYSPVKEEGAGIILSTGDNSNTYGHFGEYGNTSTWLRTDSKTAEIGLEDGRSKLSLRMHDKISKPTIVKDSKDGLIEEAVFTGVINSK